MMFVRIPYIILYIVGSSIAVQRTFNNNSSYGLRHGRNLPNSVPIQWCGQTYVPVTSERIINGVAAVPHEFPWMCKLLVDNLFFCGGSLIAYNYVVTAGHCVAKHKEGTSDLPRALRGNVKNYETSSPNRQTVILGAVGATENDIIAKRRVLKIILHPNYDVFDSNDYMMQTNDIALLRIEPIEFNQFISPICLPRQGEEVPDGTMMSVAGWGLIQEESKDRGIPALSPNSLMKNSMKKISWKACRNNAKSRPFLAPEYDLTDERIICMLGSDTDACQGDSGGGVVQRTPQGFILQGIVSWGIGCNQDDFPSAYTRVSSYVNFIHANTIDAIYLPMKPKGETLHFH